MPPLAPLAEPHAGQIASALLSALAAGGNLLVFLFFFITLEPRVE